MTVSKTKRGMFDPLAGEQQTPPKPPAKKRRKKYPYDAQHSTIGVSVPRATKTRLQTIAAQRGVTISELIRAKVDEILTEYTRSLSST